MVPGLSHAAIAAGLTLLVAVPAWVLGGSLGLGAAFAVGFYVGRERRQSEEWAGSNRIAPWRWKPRALRDVAWPALAAAVVTGLLLLALPALAHQAPSGWDYDRECCHNFDCAAVRDGLIREVQGGYRVTLRAGQHPMLSGAVTVDLFIPHGDRRIRVSGDENRHACVTSGGHVFCIYVPPGGV